MTINHVMLKNWNNLIKTVKSIVNNDLLKLHCVYFSKRLKLDLALLDRNSKKTGQL